MAQKYNARRDLLDNREFKFGQIWKLRDKLIRLLPSDRIEDDRTYYASRTVVVVQNCIENNDEDYLIVRVAPLTTTVEFEQKFDVILYPNDGDEKKDDVKEKCMAQVQLTQPILKKDMFEVVGEISNEKKNEVAAAIMKMLGIDMNNLQ
ncbi:type II toxin-antitoxin system PemK/MazF family toxin [Aneurinibacillus sp. Ricciae_BoGa-3]|uniref:type II toxin-antitoxin system PemK/MazF family toxin n=1 Tax=Aneurinibacillus sp. Ricciae_BoGa-3 TaxID=3022697 RepID=UPI00233FD77F|nr:type II toxin-antitoxin system PemK/MazF family toxin [Aneurinibacillus sp. Ricciae_BoGa-3]WCK55131.1 type II toxin-antitoxin system PemK/MazF family toxin [Aneurinibacillus sp. Ricciae_BoGa-3]